MERGASHSRRGRSFSHSNPAWGRRQASVFSAKWARWRCLPIKDASRSLLGVRERRGSTELLGEGNAGDHECTRDVQVVRILRLKWRPNPSVLENTIFGLSSQMRANSSKAGVADGSVSAVGQYSTINWYRRRPYKKALISRALSLKNECSSSSTSTQSRDRLGVSTNPSIETDME